MRDHLQNGTAWFAANFEKFEARLNGDSTSKLHAVRRDAMERFARLGFPTTKDEEWRFTNLASMAKIPFTPSFVPEPVPVDAEAIREFTFGDFHTIRLVFVDGHFREDLSVLDQVPPNVSIGSLAPAVRGGTAGLLDHLTRYTGEGDALTSLNTAFLQDGVLISVPDGVEIPVPVHVLYLSSDRVEPFLSTPRNLVMVGAGSRLSIVETYAGLAGNIYFTNAVSEIVLGDGAVVEHDKLQVESRKAYHIGAITIYQKARSSYTANSISLGGALVRNTVTSVLDDEHCVSTLNGLSIGTGRQLVDNHTVIDHVKPNCNSHELYKAILDGRSRGVFNGKIFVRRDAQKTDAKQTNKTLLLSDDATIDTKPQLEIFADDVKCTHGATVGQLDDEQLFYLGTRGIGPDEARAILTFAFASDIVQRVHIEPLRDQLDGLIRARLLDGRVRGDGHEAG